MSDSFDTKYTFKTEKLVDPISKEEIGETRKHPEVETSLPDPMGEAIAALAGEDSPVKTLVTEAIRNIVYLAGRQQINEWREKNPNGTFTANDFDFSRLTLTAIANMPKKARGGYAPSREELESFCEDYVAVMTAKVHYAPQKVATHVRNFKQGLIKLKDEKNILAKVGEMLDTWASHTEAMDEHQQVYEWMTERVQRWLAREERDLEAQF